MPPQPKLVEVDVYDRTNGTALPVHAKDGRTFVVGAPGHEYAVRIRNCTGGRVLVAGLAGTLLESADGGRTFRSETLPDRKANVALLANEAGFVLFGEGGCRRPAADPGARP